MLFTFNHIRRKIRTHFVLARVWTFSAALALAWLFGSNRALAQQRPFVEFAPPPVPNVEVPVVSNAPLLVPVNQRETTTELEARMQQMEAILRQQALRQAELEQELFYANRNNYNSDEAQKLLDKTSAKKDGDNEPKQEKTELEKRLEKLEKSQAKEDEAAEKKKAEIGKKPTMKIQGRVHADYWAFPGTSPGANAFETGSGANSVDDRFLFRRLRLTFAGDVVDNMRYRLDVEFAVPNEPTIKDAYLGWGELPFFDTVIVGHQKRPYGLDHLNSSNYNIFLERPTVVEAFNQDARRFGVQSHGVSENEAWNWRYGAFLPQDMQGTGVVTATSMDEVYQTELAGRLANTAWYDEDSDGRGYAHWAVAGSLVHPDGDALVRNVARFQSRPEGRTSNRWIDTGSIAGADNYQLLALEGVANWGTVQLVGEYQQAWVQRDAAEEVSFHGGYVYLSYFLTGEHMPWDRASGTIGRVQPFENFFWVRTADGSFGRGWGAWQVALRYSHADFSDQDILGGVSDELSFGLVWYWSAYARLLFNVEYGDITQHAPVDGFTDGTFTIIGTRCHVDF